MKLSQHLHKKYSGKCLSLLPECSYFDSFCECMEQLGAEFVENISAILRVYPRFKCQKEAELSVER